MIDNVKRSDFILVQRDLPAQENQQIQEGKKVSTRRLSIEQRRE
jgi:hypothetical protein